MDSLKDLVDEVFVADEILFDLDTVAVNETLLYVEGDSDAFVFKKFVNPSRCKIEIKEGDKNLVKAIEKHNAYQKKGILAIKDSDFDNICGYTLPPNVVSTDGHDLEVMILRTMALDHVIDARVRNESYGRVNEFKRAVRDILFKLGSLIGYFRLKSCVNGWGLKIEAGRFLKHLSSNCELSFKDAMREFQTRFPRVDISNLDEKEFEELYRNHSHDLCRGHDMVHILGQIFKKLAKNHFGKGYQPGSDLAEKLYLAFSESDFASTKLCRAIENWEDANDEYRFLNRRH